MPTSVSLIIGLGLMLPAFESPTPCEPDLGQLQEVLADRQDPRGQSQAGLLLVQSGDPDAESVVRNHLRQTENEETFIALATAVRLRGDERFTRELLAALGASRLRVRQAAAETLAALPSRTLVSRLQSLLSAAGTEVRVRQMALWTLGRSGRMEAVPVLIAALEGETEELRRIAGAALTDLTGQTHGLDLARWKHWWSRHRDHTAEQWLQMRLAYQSTRAQRLEGDLFRARAQVLRLHQQLYSRLPAVERYTLLQGLPDQDDPAVRALAVGWTVDLLPTADTTQQKTLARILLRLSSDSAPEVQKEAVVALGRLSDLAAFERLQELSRQGSPLIRAAAIRALALQARGNTPEARVRLKMVVPQMQKALEDRELEVVVEAAEALGMLGAPEAGPVLIGLLRHPSEHVRQTAAQALERTADAGLLDGLLRGLEDPAVMVRFSLLGALARSAGNGQALPDELRKRLYERLDGLMRRDVDAGVRSRAATVLGECGTAEVLPLLWQHTQVGADGRVQEKAWEAFIDVLARLGDLTVLEGWNTRLAEAKQGTRRVQLWGKLHTRWEQIATMREQANTALEGLAQAQLDLGKWSVAAPMLQTLLARTTDAQEVQRTRYLKGLTEAARLGIKEGQGVEVLRLLQEARPYLGKLEKLAVQFDQLEKEAGKKE
ncbi:MAG: HEAT repeat domain-containing protein [Gemmataceae bacterium]